jgi:hypothetical protein
MYIFRFMKYCGKANTSTEYFNSKSCSQIDFSSFDSVIFRTRAINSELDTKHKIIYHICALSCCQTLPRIIMHTNGK